MTTRRALVFAAPTVSAGAWRRLDPDIAWPSGTAPAIVTWDEAAGAGAGIYFARVRQGAREATVRLVTF